MILMVSLEALLYVNYVFQLNYFIITVLVIGIPSIFVKEKAAPKDALKNVHLQ